MSRSEPESSRRALDPTTRETERLELDTEPLRLEQTRSSTSTTPPNASMPATIDAFGLIDEPEQFGDV